jgi:hypothetical protein
VKPNLYETDPITGKPIIYESAPTLEHYIDADGKQQSSVDLKDNGDIVEQIIDANNRSAEANLYGSLNHSIQPTDV